MINYEEFNKKYKLSKRLYGSIMGSHEHFNSRLKSKFNKSISIHEYMNLYVRDYDLSKVVFKGRYPKFRKGNKIFVYLRNGGIEYPITVYPISQKRQRSYKKL